MLAKEDYSLSKMYKNIQFYVPMQTKFESDNMIKRNKILKYSLWEPKTQNVILQSCVRFQHPPTQWNLGGGK
jgi:hypothetical protein